jgi:hypothetical protein
MKPKPKPSLYGVVAEFDAAETLIAAALKTVAEGYRKLEAYSPFPIEGLDEALGFHRSRVPLITLIGGIVGGVGGFFMQWFAAVIHYPTNIGGRPLNSWPAFIPVTFELTILCAAIATVLGMLGLNGLPMPYHPLFNVKSFERASRDRFFLCIESKDPKFDREGTKRFLESLNPKGVYDVEH